MGPVWARVGVGSQVHDEGRGREAGREGEREREGGEGGRERERARVRTDCLTFKAKAVAIQMTEVKAPKLEQTVRDLLLLATL